MDHFTWLSNMLGFDRFRVGDILLSMGVKSYVLLFRKYIFLFQ